MFVEAGGYPSVKVFIREFAHFIIKNYQVQGWIFKMDCQISGKGIAVLNINCQQIANLFDLQSLDNLAEHYDKIRKIVKYSLLKKLSIACRTVYDDELDYIKRFIFEGGIIEAHADSPIEDIKSPSIVLHIEPDGTSNVIGTYDKL